MQNVLNKAIKPDVRRYPFLHIVINDALDSDFADQLLSEFPAMDTITGGNAYLSNQRFSLSASAVKKTPSVSQIWKEFVDVHLTQVFSDQISELFDLPKRKVGVRTIDDFNSAEVLLDSQICINTPVIAKSTSVKIAHVDNERELFAGLLYLRPTEDRALGGELELYEKRDSKIKFHGPRLVASRFVRPKIRIPYKHNTLVFFINSENALHGVTARQVTSYPRYLYNFIGEVKDPLFDITEKRENLVDKVLRHVWN